MGSSPVERLADNARVTVRRAGTPDPNGRAVVYWMQRAQRASDNPAFDLAIEAGNELGKPVVVFFGLVSTFPGANLRHYEFLVDGLPDIASGLARRRVGFVLRSGPDHDLERLSEDIGPRSS